MNSKPFILLGLLFAIVVLCSMDVNTVTARDKKLLWKLMNLMTMSTAMVMEEDTLESSNNASMVATPVVVAVSAVVASVAARLAGETVVDIETSR
ncbi:hypothetical protein E5676_scaffold201G00290 [Cucumis melo var. makuwa]|uniref:Uncharacterized protein n=1 Tax=Cucumis melo var. makuwa TaxID=1194695 RepID=A0A5D3BSW6_CUCMM|nr:hypothetical protein E5676_scaffold201G00290 [Cucumis melo var. makuwa]